MNGKLIREIINLNAEWLGIPAPEWRLVPPDELPARTVRAATNSTGTVIAINKAADFSTAELFFVLSHEMRHCWQVRTPKIDIGLFHPSTGENMAEYNRQPAEIDANAWAVIMCGACLGIRPLLETTLGTETWALILARISEIKQEDCICK